MLKVLNMMDIKEVLLQRFINVLIKKLLLCVHGQRPCLFELHEINLLVAINNENMCNKKLAKELHKPTIKKFKKRKAKSQ